jgi:hypothetical protein
VIVLPRLARRLHHPGLAALLGVVLVAICIVGLVSGDIPKVWSILVGVVGVINLSRFFAPEPDQGEAA